VGLVNATLAALWPPPAVLQPVRALRVAGEHYLAVPSTGAPRLLVPSRVPGADRMLARHGGGRRTRVARRALRLAHRVGLTSLAPMPRLRVLTDPAGIEKHLTGLLGRPVRLGVLLGPPRANLKPVLQVFAPDGTVLAFAKVATTAVTAPLLSTEAEALRQLALRPVPGVRTPALLDHGCWRDLQVLVQEALPSAQSGRQPTVLPAKELAAVAASGGLRRTALDGSAFWDEVSDVGSSRWHGLDVSPMGRLRDAVPPGAALAFGAWHGDFGPWNAAWGDGELEVWDWERFDPDVPAGLDAAHWRAQVDLGTDPTVAWRAMCLDVLGVLDLLSGPGPDDEPAGSDGALVAACYVLAIWSRYRRDAGASATSALRTRVAWLCDLAEVAQDTVQEGDR
jgi:hypothetical protein